MKKLAVIDIGSNTVLYLLASDEVGLTVLDEGIVPTRLGKGMGADGRVHRESVDATMAAVTEFVKSAHREKADEVTLVATEAVRRASWGKGFTREVEDTVRISVRILSPHEEGELTLLAARRSLPLSDDPITVVDVGGGSAQVTSEKSSVTPHVDSYPLGCVLLTERFTIAESLDRSLLADYLEAELSELEPAPGLVVITGGTATAAAAIIEGMSEYSPDELHGKMLSVQTLRALADKISGLSLTQKKNLAGMPPARADIFEAGLLALLAILDKSGNDEAVLSCRGVRFGVAYGYFDGPAE
jgi:exopolyphosphatase/guanosine-5'-triphosphate,3'-diphosphate pyrophosphatase